MENRKALLVIRASEQIPNKRKTRSSRILSIRSSRDRDDQEAVRAPNDIYQNCPVKVSAPIWCANNSSAVHKHDRNSVEQINTQRIQHAQLSSFENWN